MRPFCFSVRSPKHKCAICGLKNWQLDFRDDLECFVGFITIGRFSVFIIRTISEFHFVTKQVMATNDGKHIDRGLPPSQSLIQILVLFHF